MFLKLINLQTSGPPLKKFSVDLDNEECPEKTTYRSLDDGEGTVYASSSSYFGWNKYKQSRAYVCKPKFWAGLFHRIGRSRWTNFIT